MKKSPRKVLSRLKKPKAFFATVSGILTTKPDIIEWIDREAEAVGIITTKSYQLFPNEGNREPIIAEPDTGCFGNAVGLRNPGMEKGVRDLKKLRTKRDLRALLNVSLSGSSPDEFCELVEGFDQVADCFELNFSCPHAEEGYGASIGSDKTLVKTYVEAVRRITETPFFVKLTPNVPSIGEIAVTAYRAGADGISGINTVGPEVYKEPITGEPVLSNPKGNAGGKSGLWIRETALEKITEIREYLGPDVPVIGMGGIFSAEDARAMLKAGADFIGLGSVFAFTARDEIPSFTSALAEDIKHHNNRSAAFITMERKARYKHLTVDFSEVWNDLAVLKTKENLFGEPGQFYFLWVPGVGEKPFTLAGEEPARFLIRERGAVSHALCRLKSGDALMIRGPYGAPAVPGGDKAWVIAGGTGIALVPSLALAHQRNSISMDAHLGVKNEGEKQLIEKHLTRGIKSCFLSDRKDECTILRQFSRDLEKISLQEKQSTVYYIIGPLPFMQRAAGICIENRISSSSIFLCLETRCMCGIGLCGECSCGEKLTCRDGTILPLSYLEERAIALEEVCS